MSAGYTSVQWNRHKKVYDAVLAGLVALSLATFAAVSLGVHPRITAETLILRATAVTSFLLLHVILCIGPLARLDRRFLPLLYNRRHLGVTTFLLAAVHAVLATFQFHALGNVNPLLHVFTAYRRDYNPFAAGGLANLPHFPFELLGAAALLILFYLAATSHDFWNKNLGPSFWKTLHVLVLVAYGLLVLHVAYGALQSERSPLYPALLALGAATVAGLHLAAARREARVDRQRRQAEAEGFERACRADALREGRGTVVMVAGERRAVFRHQGKLFALANVCRHQGGPLGEGRIVDGCVTCPWHGWQYRPEDGCSPPPFTEVVPTYPLRLVDGEVYVHRQAHPPGLVSPGLPAGAEPAGAAKEDEFYVGYLALPAGLERRLRRLVAALAVAVPVTAALLAWAQSPIDSGIFEFGVTRSFTGVLYETPLPVLHLRAPDGAGANLLLAGFGKTGLPPEARGHHGKKVAFDGSLIYRQGLAMVEMNAPESFRVLGEPAADAGRGAVETVGEVDLAGELVDTKCYLGVMRPATGKVHRACAILCLAGGVPPGLLVRGEGQDTVLLLAGAGQRPLNVDVDWAGRQIRVRGTLELHGEVPVLRVEEAALIVP